MLVSIFVYTAVSSLSRAAKLRPSLVPALFWAVVLATTCVYSCVSMRRNPAWADDEALFTAALHTCPSSAKMNLLVAKIHLPRNATLADRLLKRAIEIDPDYCDTGLVQLQLDIHLRGDLDAALRTAARTLRCVYVMREVWALMGALFQHMVDARPADGAVLERIGDTCVQAGVALQGARFYQDALLVYLSHGRLVEALAVSLKTEQAIPLFFLAGEDRESQREGVQQTTCRAHALGGVVRAHLLAHEGQLRGELRGEAGRARELLTRALDPACEHSHSVTAIPHLLRLLREEVRRDGEGAALAMLEASELALRSLARALLHPSPDAPALASLRKEVLGEASALAMHAGRRLWLAGDPERAALVFGQGAAYARQLGECSDAAFWSAAALAMTSGFASNASAVDAAALALESTARCPSLSREVRRAARDSLTDLLGFAHQTQLASARAEPVGVDGGALIS